MSDKRPETPEHIKIILRQEAGFGCCACGKPILDYHHIIPWATRNHFDPPDMMAVCPEHHDMCTKGAVPEQEQRAWKANPANIQKGYTNGLLKVNQDICVIETGTCTIGGQSTVFSINSEPLLVLSVKERRLALSLTLYGPKGVLLAQIHDNEWIAGNPSIWDITASYQKLRLRTKKGDVRLEIDATKVPLLLKAKLFKDGKTVVIKPSGIRSSGGGGNLQMKHAALFNAEFNFITARNALEIKDMTLSIAATQEQRLKLILDHVQTLS